jgi:hypothetical protein
MINRRAVPGLVALVLVACSSGGDSGVNTTNHPPTITFTFAKLAVPRALPADLTVSVDDPDEDKLTVTWDFTRGSWDSQNASNTIMRWTPPATVGVDTVTVRVSDGTVSKTVTAVVKVGFQTTTQTARSRYRLVDSPYIITLPTADPALTVDKQGTVVEPGVEIFIDTPETEIAVLGPFDARGTADQPIVFRPNDRTLLCADDRGWWEGILANRDDANDSDGFVDLEYAQVWYARAGVRLLSTGSATVRNCEIRCSGDAGLLIGGNGTLVALDSNINNGSVDGILVHAITSLPDSVHIQGCTIGINGGAGLRLDLADPFQTVPIFIEYNTIEFNQEHGISLARSVFPQIHYNHFRGNGDATVSNIYLQSGYPDGAPVDTLDATCNFWGAAIGSQSTIDQMIHDKLDSGTVGTRVKSCPWLNEDPITIPPVCSMSCP